MTSRTAPYSAFGQAVPRARIGSLTASEPCSDGLATRLSNDGYLLLRGAFSPALAAVARLEVLERLAAVDEIEQPVGHGVASGRSNRRDMHPDLSAFWRSVSTGKALRRATHGDDLRRLLSGVLGLSVVPHDYVFLRVAVGGRATTLHCDYPFFTRTTEKIWTTWLVLSEVSSAQGPIYLVEGSHRFSDHVASMRGFDLARDQTGRRATIADDPLAFAAERNARLLTAEFAPGDLLLFGMHMIHGAFDHQAAAVRVTCDVRWQDAEAARDPRYFGEDPGGSFGGGYGELNGAKPLTEDWHQR